jgi:hypothetical protein
MTRFRLDVLITFARLAASIVSANSSSTPASPRRFLQRVRLDGSTGGFVCKYVSPVNTCQYGFSSHCQTTSSSDKSKACCKYSSPPIRRGDVAGRPRDDTKLALIAAFSRSQSIRSASRTSGCFKLICSRSGWRKKSPSGTGVFGPIHTSSGFAGFTHQYARFLQVKQHRFGFTALLRMPRRIVQVGLSRMSRSWRRKRLPTRRGRRARGRSRCWRRACCRRRSRRRAAAIRASRPCCARKRFRSLNETCMIWSSTPGRFAAR